MPAKCGKVFDRQKKPKHKYNLDSGKQFISTLNQVMTMRAHETQVDNPDHIQIKIVDYQN